ncbi:MAG: preprotein translocase subunit SecE [bacterium]
MKLVERPAKFFADVNQEMSKVSWPSYEELKSSTIVVVILSLISVVFVFFSDWLLQEALRLIF